MVKYFKLWFLLTISVMFSCKSEDSEIGDRHFQNHEYEQAIKAYTEYLRLQPRDVKSIYNRGRAYEELGQYKKALEDFHRVTKEDPLNTNALLSIIGDFYYRQKDYENTVYHAEKVLKIDPNSVRALTFKGKGHQKLGEIREAMESYNDAISINREHADTYVARGSLFLFLRKTSRACADFKMAQAFGDEQSKKLVVKYCK